jgi:hypothetical protein
VQVDDELRADRPQRQGEVLRLAIRIARLREQVVDDDATRGAVRDDDEGHGTGSWRHEMTCTFRMSSGTAVPSSSRTIVIAEAW